jgi:hypothetical protein
VPNQPQTPTTRQPAADTCGETSLGMYGRQLGPCLNDPGHPKGTFHRDVRGAEWREYEQAEPDDTNLTEGDIDRMMAEGTPVQLFTAPGTPWTADDRLKPHALPAATVPDGPQITGGFDDGIEIPELDWHPQGAGYVNPHTGIRAATVGNWSTSGPDRSAGQNLRFTASPRDPEAERVAEERARQAAAESERSAAWLAAYNKKPTEAATTSLQQRIAQALREHGMVHLGNQVSADEYDCCAEAVQDALEQHLHIGEEEAWCKTCRRVWEGKHHQCESDAEQQAAKLRDRLAHWKTELQQALSMDPTRDWDDIRNAAAGIRRSERGKQATIDRVHTALAEHDNYDLFQVADVVNAVEAALQPSETTHNAEETQ